jgi:hypothetical protein
VFKLEQPNIKQPNLGQYLATTWLDWFAAKKTITFHRNEGWSELTFSEPKFGQSLASIQKISVSNILTV